MIVNAKNARWTDASKTKIILDVKLSLEMEWMSFIASPNDCTDYGPMLYNFAVNGVFGDIGASNEELIIAGVLPVPDGYAVQGEKLVNIAAIEYEATAELNRRLEELQTPEVLARAEIDEEFGAERKMRLAALLDVRQQDGWPVTVAWPE